jgi:hypothetical protein
MPMEVTAGHPPCVEALLHSSLAINIIFNRSFRGEYIYIQWIPFKFINIHRKENYKAGKVVTYSKDVAEGSEVVSQQFGDSEGSEREWGSNEAEEE